MSFSPDRVIMMLFAVCLVIGAFDHFRGDKWGLGERFRAGLQTFPTLFLSMAGFIVLTPLLGKTLAPVAAPLYTAIGADPAMFAGTILANDNGGYPLAQALALDPRAADLGGMILGSILGVNFVFTLPAGMQMVGRENRRFLFTGLLLGLVTVPLGFVCGGLAAGFPVSLIAWQLPPIVLIATAAGLMLWLIPEKLAAFLGVFGKCIEAVALFGAVLGIVVSICGLKVKGLETVENALIVVGLIAVVLPGVYVFTTLLERGFRKPLNRLGEKLRINDCALLGMITALANDIPTLLMVKDMDDRGKLMNCAFLTGGAFALGDHLAFCGAVAPKLIVPLLAAKLIAAVSTAFLAAVYLRYLERRGKQI